MSLTVLPTKYKGYRFRSRLEARWAVFFDALGLRWEYEPEGFSLDGEPYLPDFLLPQLAGGKGLWLEVKPEGIKSADADNLMRTLTIETLREGTIVRGSPELVQRQIGAGWDWHSEYQVHSAHFMEGCWDAPYLFCICPTCNRVGYEFDGRGGRVCRGTYSAACKCDNGKAYSSAHTRIKDAIEASKCRFWDPS